MKEKIFINARIIDPSQGIDEEGSVILDKNGKVLKPFTFEKKKFVTALQALGNITGPTRPIDSSAVYGDGDPAR